VSAPDRPTTSRSPSAVLQDSRTFLTLTVGGLLLGIVGWLVSSPALRAGAWVAAGVIATGYALVAVLRGLLRRQPGVDVIAVLALAGALGVGEFAAAAVIAVMLATGRWLEDRAQARAGRDLSVLLARAPRSAHLVDTDGSLRDVPLDVVAPGDHLLVRPGEVVPVDGVLLADAVFDESALSGEPLPVTRPAGDGIRSGVVNAGAAVRLRATAAAAASTYAGIVRLVESAHADTAPSARIADKYAAWFVPLALAVAGVAWLVSGDPVRAVAVLVVATPCPLLLAVPIAIVSGMSRCARRGVVVKGGAVLEQLAQGRVLLFDKTGTLTVGRPEVLDLVAAPGADAEEVLRLAASLEQGSPHVVATSVVREATSRGLVLTTPTEVVEDPGSGVSGLVGERRVAVGRRDFVVGGPRAVADWARHVGRRAARVGAMTAHIAVDGELTGTILLSDRIRPDAIRMVRALRRAGITRLVMVSGDRQEVADQIGAALGLDEVLGDRSPAEKVEAVRRERRFGCTIMVGDGLNDAPALALADIGVALGARGATASSEAADVVLTVERVDRLAEAIGIAQRCRRIARQSVIIGMALSLMAMVAAAVGLLPPLVGAILQEVIDVVAILSALRAVVPGRAPGPRPDDEAAGLLRRYSGEHPALWPVVNRVRTAADGLDGGNIVVAMAEVRETHRLLVQVLLPHEAAEDTLLYPAVGRVLGGYDPTLPMSRTHAEIHHQVHLLGRLVVEIGDAEPTPEDVADLRPIMYGLYAVLALHFAQEEEGYFSLVDDEGPRHRVHASGEYAAVGGELPSRGPLS
jgi:heavy metal translocating P-type ATPase